MCACKGECSKRKDSFGSKNTPCINLERQEALAQGAMGLLYQNKKTKRTCGYWEGTSIFGHQAMAVCVGIASLGTELPRQRERKEVNPNYFRGFTCKQDLVPDLGGQRGACVWVALWVVGLHRMCARRVMRLMRHAKVVLAWMAWLEQRHHAGRRELCAPAGSGAMRAKDGLRGTAVLDC
eukprot:1137220-Pelagomonas_calceolata.AAC.4